MALDAEIKEQLGQYLQLLESEIVLQAQLKDDANSQKVKEFLQEIVAMSPMISLEEKELPRTPSFRIAKKGQESGVEFAGLPLGHEFTSFILALLQVSGRPPKVETDIVKRIQAVDEPMHFETYVSLTCHNCPDVVQAFNIMSVVIQWWKVACLKMKLKLRELCLCQLSIKMEQNLPQGVLA